MNALKDALKSALVTSPVAPGASAPLVAREPVIPAADVLDSLPDPLTSEWVACMRRLGAEVPNDPSMGQLKQRSDKRARELKLAGRGRDSAELTKQKEDFVRDRARRAWALVKSRFEALALSEKAYRSLKQEDADPERILLKLRGNKGDALRSAGAVRIREVLGAK